jgi:serine/threonine protein kinase
MRKLEHPNLTKLIEVHETDNSLYLILEYFNGGTLHELLNSDKKLKKCQVFFILKGIVEGLSYLHDHQIIHRDLKLDNILFDSENFSYPKIADFGLASFVNEIDKIYPRCGTPGYVAPEVINAKSKDIKYNCASDIFSIGVIYHKL